MHMIIVKATEIKYHECLTSKSGGNIYNSLVISFVSNFVLLNGHRNRSIQTLDFFVVFSVFKKVLGREMISNNNEFSVWLLRYLKKSLFHNISFPYIMYNV